MPEDRDGSLLRAEGLVFERDGETLIDGIDLDVVAGRCLAIMGANGAGKSLLVRLLHGLIAPTRGRVLAGGRPLDRAARDRQAMLFQRPVMLRRSVAGNLRFALAARRVPRAERAARLREALLLARLEDRAEAPARVLSGGERQRLAFARALVAEPEVLFLDEPTASLDPASTAAIESLVGAARARGTTPVIVTHDAGQARRLADDIAFLHAGRVCEHGPASQVLDDPRSAPARDWLAGRLPTSGARPPVSDGRPFPSPTRTVHPKP